MDRPPFTDEQLDYLDEQNEAAEDRGSRKALKRAFIGYLILFAGVVAMYQNGQSVSSNERDEIRHDARVVAVSACNARYKDRVEVREILIQARRSVRRQYRAGVLSDEQFNQSMTFYRDRLAGLPLPDCREADDALEEGGAEVEIPEPLHPPDRPQRGT